MRVSLVIALSFIACSAAPASAQLADPGKNDQFVSLFGTYTNDGGFAGSVSSKGQRDLSSLFSDAATVNLLGFVWQLDYGSIGTKRVTATGTVPPKEADVSKNSGEYVLSYAHLFSTQIKLAIEGGIEHKRTSDDSGSTITNLVTPVAMASVRHLGAKQLGDVDAGQELAWLLQANAGTAGLLAKTGKQSTEVFVDPLAVVWFSFLAGRYSQNGSVRLFYRLQFRGEAALMYAPSVVDATGVHWDTSLTYYFTPANGVGIRRFSGYFDHNLRDRKDAWTFMLVWKFA